MSNRLTLPGSPTWDQIAGQFDENHNPLSIEPEPHTLGGIYAGTFAQVIRAEEETAPIPEEVPAVEQVEAPLPRAGRVSFGAIMAQLAQTSTDEPQEG